MRTILDFLGLRPRATRAVLSELTPIFSAHSRAEFEAGSKAQIFRELHQTELQIITSMGDRTSYTVSAWCAPCGQCVQMAVDMEFGGHYEDKKWVPNWRERLVCPLCNLNNRQRLVATLLLQRLRSWQTPRRVYVMERVTPFYAWAVKALSNHELIGSEYLGPAYRSGDVVRGVLHEDVTSLSFEEESVDCIVSNDVFEHVPNPVAAFRECFRVLRRGGVMLATMPFDASSDVSITRAEWRNGMVMHRLPAVFHGNPVSSEGSLVFTDFGWDVLDWFRSVGFSVAVIDVYASREYGHFGGGQPVFRLEKQVRRDRTESCGAAIACLLKRGLV